MIFLLHMPHATNKDIVSYVYTPFLVFVPANQKTNYENALSLFITINHILATVSVILLVAQTWIAKTMHWSL